MTPLAETTSREPKTGKPAPPASARFGLFLAGVMIALVLVGPMLFKRIVPEPPADTPRHVVGRWIEAQRSGDLEAMQLISTDPLREILARQLHSQPESEVAAEWQRQLAGVESFAFDVPMSLGDDRVAVRLQLISRNHRRWGAAELVQRQNVWYLSRIAFADPDPPPAEQLPPEPREPSTIIEDR